jgi:hypothetical protein
MRPLNRKDLDQQAIMGCEAEGCDHTNCNEIYIHARCHIRGGVEVCYKKATGTLVISCALCHQLIVNVAVANENEPRSFAE